MNPVKASTRDTHEVTHLREEELFTASEVATTIKGIKSGIRPEMLKALTEEEILWLTGVYHVAWKFFKTPRDWQTNVIIPILVKGDRRQYTNYKGISLLSLPGKLYAKCPERKCREIESVRFPSGSQHHGPNLHSKANLHLRNLGSMAKISLHALPILKKHRTEFLGIRFGRFCGSMALMVSCYVP